MQNCQSEKVQSYRYLGVLITADLTWSGHVASVCTKAGKHLGFLYRKFYNYAEPKTLKTLYVVIIRPHLEYAVPVWDPHLKKDIVALESVQRLATKICTKSWNSLSYNDRLNCLHLPTLESRGIHLKLCHLYKVLNGLSFFPTHL